MECEKLKVFVSYSHDDEQHFNKFKKHIFPLTDKNLIEVWYDRQIIPGQDLQDTIDFNLENADIILLFISANFLSSSACKKEQERAFELKAEKGTYVVSIILAQCGWLDDNQIPSLLVLPTDGRPIDDFNNSDHAWNNVYNGLKSVIETLRQIKNLKFAEVFNDFLQDAEMLTKAHSKKVKVFLDDVFVYPELEKYDDVREYEKKENSEKVIQDFLKYSKLLIAGEKQSGKTSLCKKIIISLKEKNFIPVYIFDKNGQYQGKIENKISTALKDQYKGMPIENLDRKRVVPILDDFHFAKHKEKIINDLKPYQLQLIIVDDIFSLNFKEESLIQDYKHFKVEKGVRSCLLPSFDVLLFGSLLNNANDSNLLSLSYYNLH